MRCTMTDTQSSTLGCDGLDYIAGKVGKNGGKKRNEKVESMVLADEPCPDCGSNHHRSCKRMAAIVAADNLCDSED